MERNELKSVNRRYITVLIALAATWLASSSIKAVPPPGRFAADLETIPVQIGQWQGRDEPLSKDVLEALGGDSVIYRIYTDLNTGVQVGLHVVYRKLNRGAFMHYPEACYPASGWTITEREHISLFYGGRDVTATGFTAEREGARTVVAYWFSSGRRTESSIEGLQIRMILDRLALPTFGWAFIRLDTAVDASPEEAVERIRTFARVVADDLYEVQTGEKQGKSANP